MDCLKGDGPVNNLQSSGNTANPIRSHPVPSGCPQVVVGGGTTDTNLKRQRRPLSDKEAGKPNLPDGWLQPDERKAARLQGRVHLPRLRGTGDLLHPGIVAQFVSYITQN